MALIARGLGAAALAAALVAPTFADAATLTSTVKYTGIGCVQYGTLVGSSIVYPWESYTMNDSTSLKSFRCPAEPVNNTDTYPDGRAYMEVYDGNNAQGVLCQIRVFDGSDMSPDFLYGSASTSNSTVGEASLTVSVAQGQYGYPNSRFYIACDLPAKTSTGVRSGILSYTFDSEQQ